MAERIAELGRRKILSAATCEMLLRGECVLSTAAADKIIENVIGVFPLPLAVAPNFIVNGRDYVVPMVVEEPSVVAATSDAARLARSTGGFVAECTESLLAGQVHVTSLADVDAALGALQAAKDELIGLATDVHPRLRERGGGARDIRFRRLEQTGATPVIAVDVFVDTCDAMGANLVNTICEAIAPRIAELSNGSIALRILSNLADRSLVTARVRYCLDELPTQKLDAETVRDRIVLASDIAAADPYRAATHNKGIMNGIDALSIATGNDWRAIEAGAHAYAASTGAYRPLTEWSATANGDLAGRITIPLKVGIVGGTLEANPAAAVGIEIAGVDSARELAELMAAVGLAQNFAALRALATSGIQEGHMRLHARSVASAAEVPDELFDELVERLVAAGEVRKWKAREILADMHQSALPAAAPVATAAGKVILLGEHAVVYGKHALALPIVDAVSAEIEKVDAGLIVAIPEWGERHQIDAGSGNAGGIGAAVALVTQKLGVVPSGYALTLHSALPRAMGLGSSAAIAVAMIRAFDAALDLGLSDDDVNALAFECEKLAHGRPSGIDNTIATYATPMLFRNGDTPELERLQLSAPPPLVIACSHEAGLTRTQVRGVEQRRERSRARYDALFDEIDEISIAGAAALLRADYRALGELMNLCHGLLNAIQVSTPELERMVSLARAAGSTGAKLTGAGGGGSIVALCPGTIDDVTAALKSAGFKTIRLDECKEA